MRYLAAMMLLALAVPAAAQEREIRDANLPRELEWRLLRMYDGQARRYDGPVSIGPREVVRGDVAARGGPFRVAGRIEGDLAMVGGNVVIEPGGRVTGSIMVVGGEVRMADNATVDGTITAYAAASGRAPDARRPPVRDRDRDPEWEWPRRRRADGWSDRGYSRLTLRAGSSYNRVEGLPVMFGPIIQTGGSNPLRIEGLAIWRTEAASLETDRMGYHARIEQFMGGNREVSLGASAFSVVDPMDRWQLSDLEASLAAVLFHRDYRDYYERAGWSAFLRLQPTRPLEARIEYRQEVHGAVAAGDPWSLFHRSDSWRLQPLAAEGDLRTVFGSLELDLRDQRQETGAGWYGRVAIERPVGGELVRPALTGVTPDQPRFIDQPVPEFVPPTSIATDFTTAFVDLRRYNTVGYRSQLNLRAVGGGSLNREPLPPQFQTALGGPGTMPGFPTFHVDCGGRSARGVHAGERFYPAYGCDRFALGQIEYRGRLSLDFGFGDPRHDRHDWWDEIDVDLRPTWAIFFNAGRGWGYEDPALGGDRDTGLLYDIGVGFLLDQFGFYAALPLNGDLKQEPRFFVRLGRRF